MSYGIWLLGIAAGVRSDGAAVLVLLAGHSDAGPVADPEIPASVGFGTAFVFGWLVHRARGALAAIEKRWLVESGVRGTRHRLACCTSQHLTPMAAARHDQDAVRARVRRRGVGLGLGLTGAALRFLSNYSADAPLHRRRLVLDLSRASAGGGGIPGVGRPVAAALGREVSVHPGRELRGAVPELSLPGAPDVHRPAAERPQVPDLRSAIRRPSPASHLASSPATPGRRAPSPSCAASPSVTARSPR